MTCVDFLILIAGSCYRRAAAAIEAAAPAPECREGVLLVPLRAADCIVEAGS